MNDTPFRLYEDVRFECASLIVGWHEDAGDMGAGIINFLKNNLKCRLLAEVEPAGFFPLNGVIIEDDVAQFPESRLYYCPDKEILMFLSHSPNAEWFRFLNTLIDMAAYHCKVERIYTVGGLISLESGAEERRMTGIFNSPAVKDLLSRNGMVTDTDYETPEGQRPTLNSFLMWVARSRDIPTASILAQVPFYLTTVDDPRSWRAILDFLNKQLELGLSFDGLDKDIAVQDEKIGEARANLPEMNALMGRLEAHEVLSPEENDRLISYIEDSLGSGRPS